MEFVAVILSRIDFLSYNTCPRYLCNFYANKADNISEYIIIRECLVNIVCLTAQFHCSVLLKVSYILRYKKCGNRKLRSYLHIKNKIFCET